MSGPSQYRCEADVVRLLESKKLSVDGLRLLHAMYHYLDNHPGWTPAKMALPTTKTDDGIATALCAHLCATTSTPGANDSGMVHRGVKDLRETGFFQNLELDGRKIRFRFSGMLANATQQIKGGKFAMVDCDIIARLRTSSQILFYTRAVMVSRSDYPNFLLPGICPINSPWDKTKRTWLAAAARVSEELQEDYLLIPQLDLRQERIIGVKVKTSHANTDWSPGKFYPKFTAVPVCVATQGRASTLTRREQAKRCKWTHV
jgi:hypothetical protein